MSRVYSTKETKSAKISAVYDTHRLVYWIQDARSEWIRVNESAVNRLLKSKGLTARVSKGHDISALEKELIRIQTNQNVKYAGPLAGYRTGIHELPEGKILVTRSPVLIEPKAGEWPILYALLEGMLVDSFVDQRPYLFGWLKTAVEALRKEKKRPGQALVLCGPPNCGKSLLQNLFTTILGGRAAKPYQFMTGLTSFNSDLFEAEHLMIEDEAASTDIRARRNLGSHIKSITVNEVQRNHGKNRDALSLSPFWRLSITVNDEPENLMVLPIIDDSLEDKIILMKAYRREMPMPTFTQDERSFFWSTLVAELPAFIDFLLKWEIPKELQSQRFGVTHYHHPEILQAIDDLAPEKKLLTFIDGKLFENHSGPWKGTAEDLERRLMNYDDIVYEVKRLLTYNTACGTYLGRLARRYPNRVKPNRTTSSREWIISPQ